jgi:hypothetical protein
MNTVGKGLENAFPKPTRRARAIERGAPTSTLAVVSPSPVVSFPEIFI